MATTNYTARTRVKINGERFLPGATIALDAETAKPFLANKSIEVAKSAGKLSSARGARRAAEEETDELEGIEFASPQAKQHARDAKLTAASFTGVTPSGADGGYTAADVEGIVTKA